MTYEPYSPTDIYTLIKEPREISDKPYMLHAAFLLSCLFEVYESDEDEHPAPLNNWGWAIPKKVLNDIVKNANEQFIYASDHGTQIDIWGRGFSIRKANAYDKSRLGSIFQFESKGDNYIVGKQGVMNLSTISQTELYKQVAAEFSDNRQYLRKVIMVAENDINDGWDKLTDMEVTMYLWAIFYRKDEMENEKMFRDKFKKDLYTTPEDDRGCWDGIAATNGKPHGLYTFSAAKVREWNKTHSQTSVIDTIDDAQANNYWYKVAINGSCK